ncbi:hypothetical protein [Pseudomonas aegrilactucae]|uniref:hypothetical protein n=1 Tax=Pseudomonas aegrilactucae TaxID=2854028 RepID=UPI0020D24B98|nr:hypothetical protein [Pseudomonas aegrilactucae]
MKQLVNRTRTDRIARSSAGSSKSTVLLSPLAVSLRMMALLPAMVATPAVAVEFLDAETRAITSSTPADSYQLINGSVLNAQGAQTAEITASNSTVNVTGGGIATTAASGLRLVNSQATIRNAQIVNTQGGGMTLVRTTSLTTGSTASVTDSVVRGGGIWGSGDRLQRTVPAKLDADRHGCEQFRGALARWHTQSQWRADPW